MNSNYKILNLMFFLFFLITSLNAQKDVLINYEKTDEYLNQKSLYDIYDANKTSGSSTELGNLSFLNPINDAFTNAANIEIAKSQIYLEWVKKQNLLIQEYLSKKFNETFASYDIARNKMFIESENDKVLKLSLNLKSQYSNQLTAVNLKNAKNLDELKLLQIRIQEINAGNFNNSQFPFAIIDGIYLKDFKDLNIISQKWYKIAPLLMDGLDSKATIQNAYNNLIGIIANDKDIKGKFDNFILNLKINYSNSCNDFERLHLIQYVINYYNWIKENPSGPLVIPNFSGASKFYQFYRVNDQFINNYVIGTNLGSISIFSIDYFYQLLATARTSFSNQYVDGSDMYSEVQNQWEREKEQAIENMLNNRNIKKWYLDSDNDGYHAKGSSPKAQSTNPGIGWREGVSKGEVWDDTNAKYKFSSLNVSLSVDNSTKPLYEESGDFRSGDLKNFQGIHDVINNSKLNFIEKVNAHYETYWDEFFDKFMTNEDYINNLRDFAEWTTFNDDLVNEMIDRFKKGDSNTHFTSNNLTNSLLGSDGFSSFKSELIKIIKNKIINDVTEDIPKILIENLKGPVFKDNGGLFSWNASHSSNLIVSNLVINCKTFTMSAKLIMYDRFGLDNDDLYSQPFGVTGIDEYIARNSHAMRGWFILQRIKGFKPFISEVSTTINLSNENF